jgi:hypothetical protein
MRIFPPKAQFDRRPASRAATLPRFAGRRVTGCKETRLSDDGFDVSDIDAMMRSLEAMRERHRALDEEIARLEAAGDQPFQVMALKREKLRVKDRISWLSSRLTPDIIA